MAALSRRLAVLEERFGPVIVEGSPSSPPLHYPTPRERLEWSAELRDIVADLEGQIERGELSGEQVKDVELWIARNKMEILCPDYCSSCGEWPMTGVGVDPDGTVRCRCGVAHGEVPRPGPDYRAELQELWFWDLLQDETMKQRLLEWWDLGTGWHRFNPVEPQNAREESTRGAWNGSR